jgi:hypothetical protein
MRRRGRRSAERELRRDCSRERIDAHRRIDVLDLVLVERNDRWWLDVVVERIEQ